MSTASAAGAGPVDAYCALCKRTDAVICHLAGTLVDKRPPLLVIDVAGVGYEVHAPLGVFSDLPATGQQVRLLIQHQFREDGQTLFGFARADERALFASLLKISGVGGKLALAILSGISADELRRAVAQQDSARLIKIPGVGKKTAERLLLELKDKVDVTVERSAMTGQGPRDARSEAVEALVTLGYKPAEASRLIELAKDSGDSAEALIRGALKLALK